MDNLECICYTAAVAIPQYTGDNALSARNRLLDERLFSLKNTSVLGHPYTTLVRWFSVGILDGNKQRVRLATIKKGGIRMTSKEAVERFYEQLS